VSLRLFNLIAFSLGLVYVFATPPFMVPDESGHMWRSFAFAQGHIMPAESRSPLSISVQDRMGVLFWHAEETIVRRGQKYGWEELRVAWQLVNDDVRQDAKVAWIYTPAAYIAQTASVWITTRLDFRPLVVFYAGRFANLAFSLLLITLAMAIAPQCRMIFALLTLLPMTMYELASWSGDAATIAYAFLFIAVVLRASTTNRTFMPTDLASISLLILMLGLCKPAYFLLAALVLAIPRGNFRSTGQRFFTFMLVAVLGAMATLASMTYFNRGFFNMRPQLPVDPAAQMQCIRSDPWRFTNVLASEVRTNGRFYIEGAIGRFGMYDVKLPMAVIYVGVLLVLVAVVTSQIAVTWRWRVIALAIFLGTSAGVIVSQYLIWSVVCGAKIEGVQGRYFLPVLPLLLIALSGGFRRVRLKPSTMYVVILACNVAAVITLVAHFWI
jgi:uncharacterized membrane protein